VRTYQQFHCDLICLSIDINILMRIERAISMQECSLRNYEGDYADRHLLHSVLAKWAREKPEKSAIIDIDKGCNLEWGHFDSITTRIAIKLIDMGFRKGDLMATFMPFISEHVILEYACFKIGVLHVPLEMRLKSTDIIYCLKSIGAKGLAFVDNKPKSDIKKIINDIVEGCHSIKNLIHIPIQEEPIERACSFPEMLDEAYELSSNLNKFRDPSELLHEYVKMNRQVNANDAAQVIFTAGSTGPFKAVLLSHQNITCQNMCLGSAFGLGERTKTLVNLPPSHVGGQTIQLMTTLFLGGTAVLQPFFIPVKSLEAIQRYNINVLGQIPSMFELEWQSDDFENYDYSSLEYIIFSGQKANKSFINKTLDMAPRIGTGLSLTETAGFCTYASINNRTTQDGPSSLGFDMLIYRLSIRKPLKQNGFAGEELTNGLIGHICFKGPQTFLGYLNDKETTFKAISRDGFLYTNDLGYENESGLLLVGRTESIIKPKGFLVFSGQIEEFFCKNDKVSACAIVGLDHNIFSEAIMAFIQKRKNVELTIEEIEKHARELPSYMRPLHYVLIEPNQIPLNRLGKIDYVRINEMAAKQVELLRLSGAWDAQESSKSYIMANS